MREALRRPGAEDHDLRACARAARRSRPRRARRSPAAHSRSTTVSGVSTTFSRTSSVPTRIQPSPAPVTTRWEPLSSAIFTGRRGRKGMMRCGKPADSLGLYGRVPARAGARSPARRSDGSGRLRRKTRMSPPPETSSRASSACRRTSSTITTELKMAARRRGEDIIDFGMGNPDGPTPKHIVDKLIETVAAPRHARLLGVEGHPAPAPRDLPLVPAPLRRRVRSGDRGDRHDRLEGRHRAPRARDARPRRHGAGAEPELSDPHLRAGDRGRRHPARADDAGRRLLRRARAGDPHAASRSRRC